MPKKKVGSKDHKRRVRVLPPPRLKAKAGPNPGSQRVTVTLGRPHEVNQVGYGPGTVVVKRDLADVLLEQERNAKDEEARFYDPSPMARVVGRGNRVRLVAPEDFETAMAGIAPLAV